MIGMVTMPFSSRLRRIFSPVTIIFLNESLIAFRERVSCWSFSSSGILHADWMHIFQYFDTFVKSLETKIQSFYETNKK